MDLKPTIHTLRNRIESDHYEVHLSPKLHFKFIDDFINDLNISDLEKAFFLMLNQFPGDHKDYIVIPGEMVLIPDVYDISSPGIEYEIDFALYGGSIKDPIKIAIECDGLRSHGSKHNNKDRRKNVNLQAAGWMVIRFGSKEIHQELEKYENDENYLSDFIISIENVIKSKLNLVNWSSYSGLRTQLTGYNWDFISCTKCHKKFLGRLNHKKHTCGHCGEKFVRKISENEDVLYEYEGLLFYRR